MALTAYQKALKKVDNALTNQPVGATAASKISSGISKVKDVLQNKPAAFKVNPLDTPQGATTGATTPATPAAAAPVTGTANTGNLTAAQIQSMREDAKRAADTAMAVSNAKTPAEKNAILRESAMQNAAIQGVPGAAQILATEQALQQKAPGVSLTQQPTAQQTAFQAYLESAAPQEQYLWRNMGENEMHTMDQGEQRLWQNAMTGYANGDYSAFNRDFQTAGNWGSYVDANGKVSGMLRYAGDGVGGYVPINNGRVLNYNQGDDLSGVVFYGPNGEAYTADASGNLYKTGTWTDQYDSVMKNGYYKNDVNDYGDRMFVGKDGQAYTYNNVPDEKLAEWGYVRRNGGIFYEPQTVAANNGGSWQQNNPLFKPGGNDGNGGGNTPSGGSSYSGSSSSGGTTPTQPVPNYQPTQAQPVQTQPVQTPYQAAIEEWSYGPAPEWNGTDYERQRDELLQNAMNPYEGSPYDQQRDDALARYGEEWQGSKYQPKRDEALRRAEEMQWNYDPNTDPVWQALQKQYRREGDRATQEALAQAAMRTGGLANSYAVTAASQAGDYYAAQLSDRLPQLYQDAYQRYLQEFQRQMGISDQYQGFDDREYSRWADQQGKNLDLADRYNQYGQQDYNRYMDRVSQQLQGADRYNQYGGTEYQRYLDQLGQYNTDRSFDYGRYRDRIGDARYADETAYDRQRDAISDQRYNQEWAQQLREYADAQGWKAAEWQQYLREYGDQLSERERQWAYQMARDAVADQQYADQTAYQRALYDQEYADQRNDTAWEQGYKQTAYNDEMERTALNYLNTNGIVTGRYAEILGVPDGTTYEQYYSRYLGGGSSSPFDETEIPSGTTPKYTPPPGGGDEGDGDDTPPGDTPPDDTGNGRTWWNGRPMTDTAYDLQSRIAYGWAQKTLTKENVQRMVYDAARKGYIEDYEIPLLMRIIGVNIQGPPQQNPNVEGPITQWTK